MKKIVVFGAVKSVLKRAKELGYETFVIEANPNLSKCEFMDHFKCIGFDQYEECLEYIKTINVDGIVNATEFAVIVAAYVTEKLGLPGMKLETAKMVKDKYLVRKVLNQKGIKSIPQFFEIKDIIELEKIKDDISFPVIIKPAMGLGSLFVYKIENYEQLKDKCLNVLENSFNKKALIETYIQGKEYGAESFVYQDEIHVLAIMEKLMTNTQYCVELGHNTPPDISSELKANIENEVKKIIRALDLTYGPVNMDIIINEEGKVYIVDIGARMGGNAINTHIIPNYIGVDHVGNTIKLALNENTIDLDPKFEHFIATRQLDLKPGKIVKVPDFSKLNGEDIIDICFEKKQGDIIKEYTSNADRAGFIVVKGKDIQDAKTRALELRNCIDDLIERE